MQAELIPVEVAHQPIELCKLLKIANLVGGGGEAKIVISQGYVLLNQEVEYQKRKKIYHDDIIEFNGDVIQVICTEPVIDPNIIKQQKIADKLQKEKLAAKKSKTANKSSNKKITKTSPSENKPTITGGRKRISF